MSVASSIHTFRLALLVAFLCTPAGCSGTHAADRALDPASVRAAFILNFITYVRWPAEAFPDEEAPLIVAASQGSNYERLYLALNGLTVGQRMLRVVHWAPGTQLPPCHVVIALDQEGEAPHQAVSITASAPILVITERKGLAERGSVINLVQRGKRLAFEINTAAAAARGLVPSSHLLRLGSVVARAQAAPESS